MKHVFACFSLALPLVVLGTAMAQESEEDRPRRGGEMRARMIEQFDADGDGQLNDEEREAAREAMRERRGQGRGGEGRGGQGRGGQGQGPRDPFAGLDLNEVFDRLDADKDGTLSREEFAEFMQQRRGPGGPRDGEARGPRGERRRPASDQESQQESAADDAAEGAADSQASGEGQTAERRGQRGDRPRGEGRRGQGPQGQRGAGSGAGRGGFDPNRMFDRFDADGDGKLGREEFTRIGERMRQMRERAAEGGPGRGPRDGSGPRRGGQRGERPPRPQRPDGAPAPQTDAPTE